VTHKTGMPSAPGAGSQIARPEPGIGRQTPPHGSATQRLREAAGEDAGGEGFDVTAEGAVVVHEGALAADRLDHALQCRS
jgi:hypothetical protein